MASWKLVKLRKSDINHHTRKHGETPHCSCDKCVNPNPMSVGSTVWSHYGKNNRYYCINCYEDLWI